MKLWERKKPRPESRMLGDLGGGGSGDAARIWVRNEIEQVSLEGSWSVSNVGLPEPGKGRLVTSKSWLHGPV